MALARSCAEKGDNSRGLRAEPEERVRQRNGHEDGGRVIDTGWDGTNQLPISVVVGHLDRGDGARRWEVMGVVAGEQFASDTISSRQMRSAPDGDLFLWSGFRLRLRADKCQDYAYNLQGEHPGVYVIARQDADEALRPLRATVSLDEAQDLDATDLRSVEEAVYTVAMPPELYRWVEHFVLDNHVHVPKKQKGRGKQRSRALFDAEVGDAAGDGE